MKSLLPLLATLEESFVVCCKEGDVFKIKRFGLFGGVIGEVELTKEPSGLAGAFTQKPCLALCYR